MRFPERQYLPLSKLSEHTQGRLLPDWTLQAKRVPVPAGALLIWDSRLVHQGWRGGPRLAQPICWEPRARRSEEALERKARLTALGLPSTHWAPW